MKKLLLLEGEKERRHIALVPRDKDLWKSDLEPKAIFWILPEFGTFRIQNMCFPDSWSHLNLISSYP